MTDDQTLKDIFAEFAGAYIKDPARFSCDIDPVIEDLSYKLQEQRLALGVPFKKGVEDGVTQKNRVRPEYIVNADQRLVLTGNFKRT